MISEQEQQLLNLKNLIQTLEQSTIDGSAITMCLLPHKNMTEYRNLLASQIAQAANIKDKSNRQSVIQNLKSARQAIKQTKKVPQNGLIIISANVMLPKRHINQKIVQVIEPHRPITKEVYSCGKNFNFGHIHEQIMVKDEAYGFIVIDGNSVLLARVKGGHKEILKEIKSDIMRNHNKGGQSSVRFSRLRDQSKYNFVKTACEETNKIFGSLGQQIRGFIVAGSANIKMDFINNENLSSNMKNKIIKVIDIAQGSEEGLKLAISQSRDIITDAILLKEKNIISDFFEQANRNSEMITNGFQPVSEVISIGIAETVVICKQKFEEQQIEEIIRLCKQNGCKLLTVSDRSQEGAQFVRSYGGIGAILRYEFDSSYLKEEFMDEETRTQGKEEFFL